jgi:predicted dehydrogenase
LTALRFGVLGTGYWAQEAHATALAAHPGAELVAVWGRDPARTEAGAGRHLLLDKPLALSLDGAERVAAAVAANRVASLVFFTLRFLPPVAAWMEQATGSGGWHGGGWHGGDGAWLGTALQPGSPFAGSPLRWRQGALWDLGPHMLSLALPTLGPVERVAAGTGLGDTVHLVALEEAIGQFAAMVAAGATTHPCDVRLGRDTVAVLEAAERFLSADPGTRSAAVG